ncbi:MAG: MBL fold metallo-hydrolase [Pseudomonadales bacterium]|nr:MBL fold metallo-hydrolase [Pseudomonadales bacterium]
MIFHRLFDEASSTYTYLLAKSRNADALIIDPVLEHVDDYLKLLGQNQLRLIKVIDTHLHADHFTGMSKLRRLTGCITCAHEKNQSEKLSQRLMDGDTIGIEGIDLQVIYTPGHTNDSICLYLERRNILFTGDTLLIRGNGRTDFQHGDPGDLYDSLMKKIFTLPGHTHIYPGHDYKGEQFSLIEQEKIENQRINGKTRDEFIEIMNNLDLQRPEMMDVVVPANMLVGSTLDQDHNPQSSMSSSQLSEQLKKDNVYFIDLREENEIKQRGTIEGFKNIPYQNLDKALTTGGEIDLILKAGYALIFMCAYGERSSLALDRIPEHYISQCNHLQDGFQDWKDQGFPCI